MTCTAKVQSDQKHKEQSFHCLDSRSVWKFDPPPNPDSGTASANGFLYGDFK